MIENHQFRITRLRMLSFLEDYEFMAFFLFSFFLPINTETSNVFLFTAIIFSIYKLYGLRLFKWPSKAWKALMYTTVPLFLLHLLGLLHTEFLNEGYRFIEKTISFLVIPVVFLFFRTNDLIKMQLALLRGLIFGSLVSTLILLALTLSRYFTNSNCICLDWDLFNYYHTYQNFTAPLEMHPTYLGVYFLTGILFLKKAITKKAIRWAIYAITFLGVIFLNSRIIFFGYLFVLLQYSFFTAKSLLQNWNLKKLILVTTVFLFGAVILIALFSNTYIGFRFKNIFRFEISMENVKNYNSNNVGNPRLARWRSTLRLISKEPIFGYGTADEQPNLKLQFEKDGMLMAAKSEYNTHNQFLGYLVRFGIFGTIILLLFFYLNLKIAFVTKNFSYLNLMLVVMMICLVENFFDRNYGITYSAVFLTVFAYVGTRTLNFNTIDEAIPRF